MGYETKQRALDNAAAAPVTNLLYRHLLLPELIEASINEEDLKDARNLKKRRINLVSTLTATTKQLEVLEEEIGSELPGLLKASTDFGIPIWFYPGKEYGFITTVPSRIESALSAAQIRYKKATNTNATLAQDIAYGAAKSTKEEVSMGYETAGHEIVLTSTTFYQICLIALTNARQIGVKSDEKVFNFLLAPPMGKHSSRFDSNIEMLAMAGFGLIGDLANSLTIPQLINTDEKGNLQFNPNSGRFLVNAANEFHGGCPVIGYEGNEDGVHTITASMKEFSRLYFEAKQLQRLPLERAFIKLFSRMKL